MNDSTPSAVIDWLLEPSEPGVRYLTLRDLIETEGIELTQAREAAHCNGPIASVLDNMEREGFWVQPGSGYYPKYTSTVWSIMLLAQLGATMDMDERVKTACAYVLDHGLTRYGQFSTNNTAPSGTADCLQGNLCSSLLDLGCSDPRLDGAFEWMARSVTGEGVASQSDKEEAIRYYAGKCGPVFACGSNNKLPCAWGGICVMQAFSKLSQEKRTPLIERAVTTGVDFFLGKDPAQADYPNGYSSKPSGNWWKFGFPVFYVQDILGIVEFLVRLGYGNDPRMAGALKLVRDKRDKQDRWLLEYDYSGKTWVDFGARKQPNKWVTLRALRVLKNAR